MTLNPTRPVRFYLVMGRHRKDTSLALTERVATAAAARLGRDGAVLHFDTHLATLYEVQAVTPLWHPGLADGPRTARQDLLCVAQRPDLVVGGHLAAAAVDCPGPAPAPGMDLVGFVR